MTAPDHPYQRWQQPTAPQPLINPKRNRTNTIILSVFGVLVLCCGGVTAIGAIAGDDEPTGTRNAGAERAAAPRQTAAPRQAVPATPSPSPEDATTATKPRPSKARPSKPSRPRKTGTTPTAPRKTTVNPAPATKTPKPEPTTKAPAKLVTPGAFCAPEGARGVSKKGKLYRCSKKSGEDRARWRPI